MLRFPFALSLFSTCFAGVAGLGLDPCWLRREVLLRSEGGKEREEEIEEVVRRTSMKGFGSDLGRGSI